MLELLLGAEGAVVSTEEILERAWDDAVDPFTNTVRMTISRLRAKLGDPPVIETVTPVGYRIGTRRERRPSALRLAHRLRHPKTTVRWRLDAALRRPVPGLRRGAAGDHLHARRARHRSRPVPRRFIGGPAPAPAFAAAIGQLPSVHAASAAFGAVCQPGPAAQIKQLLQHRRRGRARGR